MVTLQAIKLDIGDIAEFSNKEDIAASIENLIVTHSLKPGTKLPAERELAKVLNTKRSLVTGAINLLEQRGLVERKIGSGTYVTEIQVSHFTETFHRFLTLGECTHDELFTLRELIEPYVAAEAALKATPENLAELKACVEQIECSLDASDSRTSVEADGKFHSTLVQISGNHLLIAIITALSRMIHYTFVERLARATIVRHNAKTFSEVAYKSAYHHRVIYQEILAHDPEGARRAMMDHLQLARQSQVEAKNSEHLDADGFLVRENP